MPVGAYTFLHHLGLMLLFLSLGGLAALSMVDQVSSKSRAVFVALHGAGLIIVVIAGFGWLAKAGYGFPAWVILKLLVWLALGAIIVPIKRKPELARPLVLFAIPALGAIAAIVAVWHVALFNS